VAPEPLKRSVTDASFLEKIENTVNSFWFASSMVLIKLGRSDYLIAAHLVLELCQIVIVMQMFVRDEEKKTNIHRFGDCEDVPILHSIPLLKSRDNKSTQDGILNILFYAAKHMDKISEKFVKYPRAEPLRDLQNQLNL